MAARTWGFWTEHKLELLSGYLQGFTVASKGVGKTVYLDLFAGQTDNVSRRGGRTIEGSPVRALRTDPAFTTVVLFETPARATELRTVLGEQFPGRDIRTYPGDCNDRIDAALAGLSSLTWAPTFAFLDQQAAEVHWETLAKLAAHKRGRRYKVELWMLFAPGQILRGLSAKGEAGQHFADKVTRMFGTEQWRAAYDARQARELTPERVRYELTNWMRWRLEQELGYKHTHSFELRNEHGGPVYSMVFATDNEVGNKIMTHLYERAAEKHPTMREEARALARAEREDEQGDLALFAPLPRLSTITPEKLYRPSPPTVPYGLIGPDAG